MPSSIRHGKPIVAKVPPIKGHLQTETPSDPAVPDAARGEVMPYPFYAESGTTLAKSASVAATCDR